MRWRKLESGMSKDEVREILGEPLRVKAIAFSCEVWCYQQLQHDQFDEECGWVEFLWERVWKWGEPSPSAPHSTT